MKIEELRKQWETFGKDDPMRAVLTDLAERDHSWDPEAFLATGREDIDRIARMLAGHGLTLRGARALDFGCGVGRLTQGLARHFDEVVGIDISEPMLAAARQHNAFRDRVRFVQNIAPDLSVFPDSNFDFVFTHIVLQHLEPPLAVGYLREFLRVTRPGGLVVFQIPTERVRRRWRYALIRKFPWLVRAVRKVRFGVLPALEMHAVSPAVINAVVRDGGGEIRAIERDDAAGATFVSSVYVVAKK